MQTDNTSHCCACSGLCGHLAPASYCEKHTIGWPVSGPWSTPLAQPLLTLTRREYFAGLAMQNRMYASPEECAIESVRYADALITELEKPKETPNDQKE